MVPAYTTYCKTTSGSYTARAAGYANSSIIDDDDRSLQSLVTTQEMMNQAINMNNANVSHTNSSLTTLDSNQQSLNAKMNEMANQMMHSQRLSDGYRKAVPLPRVSRHRQSHSPVTVIDLASST